MYYNAHIMPYRKPFPRLWEQPFTALTLTQLLSSHIFTASSALISTTTKAHTSLSGLVYLSIPEDHGFPLVSFYHNLLYSAHCHLHSHYFTSHHLQSYDQSRVLLWLGKGLQWISSLVFTGPREPRFPSSSPCWWGVVFHGFKPSGPRWDKSQ